MRIAYFTPLSPQRSGISDHSEELLPHLAAYADIDVIVSGAYTPTNTEIRDCFRILHFEEYLRDPAAYDAAVYQVGNNLRFHAYMVPCLRAAPGIVVLQDYCLQYLVLGLTLRRGELATLAEALRPVCGKRTNTLVRRLLFGLEDPGSLTFAHPFLAASRGIIVHSEHILDLVREQVPEKPIRNVPMGVSIPPQHESKHDLRRRYGYHDDEFIVVSVSTRAPKKRLDVVLESIHKARNRVPNLKLLVVGGGAPGAKIHRMIRDYGLADIVEQTGWVESECYQHLIRLSDVAVDLRDMTAAETAHSALRCLTSGKPVVVSASGTFLELPDSCCPKIKSDGREAQALCELLVELSAQPQKLREMASGALDYANERLTLELQAREFMGFIEEVVQSTPGAGSVELLERRPSHAKPLFAMIYALSRIGFLLRSYGISDSLRRLCLILASRVKREGREIV